MESKFVRQTSEGECREDKEDDGLLGGGRVVSELCAWSCGVSSKGISANSLQGT